jgi:SAM-dependent methyltransferase
MFIKTRAAEEAMKLAKDITSRINFVLDNFCPPVLRDCRAFMKFLISLAFGKSKAELYMSFKEKFPNLSKEQITRLYIETAGVVKRETDLTSRGLDYILNFLKTYKKGARILDISCGRGFLTKKIADLGFDVCGADIYIPKNLPSAPNIKYIESDVCDLAFDDNSFDCVICSHTLEHVPDIQKAISQLRRVCKDKLIIVVPSQREYLYTFDLHVHFFPYVQSLQRIMNNPKGRCFNIHGRRAGGELFFIEDKERK